MINLSLPAAGDHEAFLIVFVMLLGLVFISEFLRQKFSVSSSITRKFVHISTSIFIFISPNFFQSNFYPALIPLLFIPFNILAVHYGWLNSLHGIDVPPQSGKKNYGTVWFPVAFLLLVLLFWEKHVWILQTAMLILGLGDATAALVGENLKKPHRYTLTTVKSLEGSLAMFVMSFGTAWFCLKFFQAQSPVLMTLDPKMLSLYALAIAIVATGTEALLSGGMDNFFVPMVAAYMLGIGELRDGEGIRQMILGVSIAAVFGRVSLGLKFLSPSGAVCAFLFAANIFSMGGLKWTVPVFTFFFLSSILSKIGKARKKKFDLIFEKGSQRDMGQVLANGGVVWLLMIWDSFVMTDGAHLWLYAAYLGSTAAVQADTWATEIGTMIRNPKPISIVTFKPVTAGTSGGITLSGTSGAFLGTVVIWVSAYLITPETLVQIGIVTSFLLVTVSGVVGSLVDSYLGATVQAMYFDPIRNKETERTHSVTESGERVANKLIKGYEWIENDLVNFACGITGAGLAFVMLLLV
jgi:uncharacterized protein (TIGR00297 family)